MLASWVNHKISVTAVYMEDIANIKFKIKHFHLEECFILQKQENNGQNLCYHLCLSN